MNAIKQLFRPLRMRHQGFCAASYRPSSELHRRAEERVRNESRLIAYAMRRLGRLDQVGW